jgi:hypothetical protein
VSNWKAKMFGVLDGARIEMLSEPNTKLVSREMQRSLIIMWVLSGFSLGLLLLLLVLEFLLLGGLGLLLFGLFLRCRLWVLLLIVILQIGGFGRDVVPVFEVLLQIDGWMFAGLLSLLWQKAYRHLIFTRPLNRGLTAHMSHRPIWDVSGISFVIILCPSFPYFAII